MFSWAVRVSLSRDNFSRAADIWDTPYAKTRVILRVADHCAPPVLAQHRQREYFANVGRSPGMFVGKTSFHMLTAFLTGYDQNALRHRAPQASRAGRILGLE